MFRLGVLGFLVGILVALAINQLNSYLYCLPIICIVVAIVFRRYSLAKIGLGFALGFAWLIANLQYYAAGQLPAQLQKQPIQIIATVASIPNQQQHLLSFIVNVQQLQSKPSRMKLKLDWYLYHQTIPKIEIGQQWQFTVKVKRPHSLMNPGSFDYLAWLAQQNISASGYIVHAKMMPSNHYHYLIGRLRTQIKNNIQNILTDRFLSNFIVALTVGVRENITSPQWLILQNTGTNHLIAIAGLHIGLVTGLIFLLTTFIWKRIPILPLIMATPRVAAMAALFVGWGYAALAGFSLPTERAAVMLTVFMGSIILRGLIVPWVAWCLALFIVLLLNPLSVLSPGFWLSFIAVALIVVTAGSQIGKANRWWRLAKVQMGLALGLFPVTLLFFNNASLIAPVANLIAIPIVGFLTVPLSLLGAILSLVSLTLAKPILLAALVTLHWAWDVLTYLSAQPWLAYQLSIQTWQAVSCLMGIALLCLPRGVPGKFLSIIFILPVFFQHHLHPKSETVWMTVLDVGQGLSVVVRTANHTLIYDTGAKFSASYDMGSAVVVPFLQSEHIQQVNAVIISHGDNDHIGGLQSVLKRYPVKRILTSVPRRINGAKTCLAGQHWIWDGVKFTMLYPNKKHLNLDNNSSCVLRITVGSKHILLTGDIERLAEEYLVKHNANQLPADIIVAPHHGSKTSSTNDFINLIDPHFVVFPTGYLNKFYFPSLSVIKRYQGLGAELYNTASDGAVFFSITSGQKIVAPTTYCSGMDLHYFRYCASHYLGNTGNTI